MTLRPLAALLALLGAASAWAGSPAEAVAAAHADAARLAAVAGPDGRPVADLHAYRYFRLLAREPKEYALSLAAFQLHLNCLSRYGRPVRAVPVGAGLVRVDTDELKWDRGTLEAARFADPFYHVQELAAVDSVVRGVYWPGGTDSRTGKKFDKNVYAETVKAGEVLARSSGYLPRADIDGLRKLLHTEVPVLDAEWFLAQSSRQLSLQNQQTGLGYYDFLQLKNRDDYFELIKFREKDSIDREVRAVQELSGVSGAPRVLVGWTTAQGPAWVALDTNDPRGKGVALKNPERGAFKHQIEEWYGSLPNGLPATFLSDDKGVRQNNAPADAAGFHDDSRLNSGRDGRIHVHLACLRCHAGQVLLPIDDYYRKHFTTPLALGAADKKRFLDLQSQYFSDLAGKLARDRAEYQDAYRRATVTHLTPAGLAAQQAAEAYARAYHGYADAPGGVGRQQAALELGVPPAALSDAVEWELVALKKTDPRLVAFARGGALNRVTWEELVPRAQEALLGHAAAGRPPAKVLPPDEGGMQ